MGERLHRIALDGWLPAEQVVQSTDPARHVIWFDAGCEADLAGATPRAGHPDRSLVGWGDETLSASVGRPGALEHALSRVERDSSSENGDQDPLGWWGWIGYGTGAHLLEPGNPAWAAALGDPDHPDLALLRVDRALSYDHASGTVTLVADDRHRAWIDEFVAWWRDRLRRPTPASEAPAIAPPGSSTAVWADSAGEYLAAIARCQELIRQGEAFVLCLTTSVTVADVSDDDLTLYRRLRRWSPAPRAVFARIDGVSLVGSSPETFVTVDRDRVATVAPIKGTRPRHADPVVDAGLADELRGSEKERAENVMIVDLMRNDLGRIAVPGSVDVTSLVAVESYRHVHQLVSTVTARLRDGVTAVDVVRAAFPPGSMTGAPKHRVVEALAALESAPRGIYSGVVGRFGFDGTVELSVVIRSIVFDAATRIARIGVGGGITASSDPVAELAEIRTKAAPLLRVLGAVPPDDDEVGLRVEVGSGESVI